MTEKKWRILLVDDEPSIVKTVSKRLELEDFEVSIALDGEEAIAKAKAEKPDLIILDLMLPKKSGFDVLAALKGDGSTMDIPLITVFSGRGDSKDEARCEELGAAGYVPKGQGAAPLIEKIKDLLDREYSQQ